MPAVKTKKRSPSRIDPSRTFMLRRGMFRHLSRQFALLRSRVQKLVAVEDAFGLAAPVKNCQPGQIRGADGRCGHGIGVGVLREEMPQIRTPDFEDFLEFVKSEGVSITERTIPTEDISPTQSEFRQERVDAISLEKLDDPILVSDDLYVLDGTHRWIKARQTEKEQMSCLVIGLELDDALDLMRQFPAAEYAENEFALNEAGIRVVNEWSGKRVGVVGPGSKLEKNLAYVGSWVHAIKSKAAALPKEFLRGAPEHAGKFLGRMGRFSGVLNLDAQWNGLIEAAPFGQPVHLPVFNVFLGNTRYSSLYSDAKLEEFKRWLQGQLEGMLTSKQEEEVWQKYTYAGWRKAAGRAFDDTRLKRLKAERPELFGEEQRSADFYSGSKAS
jgi:hypothetical protein